MEVTLQTPFNAAQVEILKLFSQGLTDEQTEELRRVLIAFRFKLLDEHVEQAVEQKGLMPEQINQASWGHRRTPYLSKQQNAQQKPKPDNP
jgi:cellobiose-specific phosphotransferase system component IIB